MHVIVGSLALKYFNLLTREVQDVDLWTDEEDTFNRSVCDVSFIPTNILRIIPTVDNHATPEAILAIKMSHFGFDILWEKHKKDILWLKSRNILPDMELYRELKAYWKEKHGNKDFLSLYGDKTEFFNDFVDYQYDHDYLHELVAHPNKPMYSQCHKDGEEVMIDRDKFFLMPFEDQIRMFREEIAVIALERWLLNPKTSDKMTIEKAHRYSLRKTVTALTKNWATDFIVENIEEFVMPDRSYYRNTLNTLKENQMSELKGKALAKEVFGELAKELEVSLSDLLYDLADGDCFDNSSIFSTDLEYPKQGDRPWIDPSFQEELKTYRIEEDRIVQAKKDEYEYIHMTSEGGGEGGTEDCFGVFSWKGVLYHTYWNYYSHQGTEYDWCDGGLSIVQAKEKLVTVYE